MGAANRSGLWRLSVQVLPEAQDAVSELLGIQFGKPASSYTDLVTGTCTVTVYFEGKPPWNASSKAELRQGLRRLTECGLKLGLARFHLARIRPQDWAESWKRHFRPVEFGLTLLIRPSWGRRQARPGQATIVLDPGLSFGTGQHPTTQFCLREIVRLRPRHTSRSFLDLGTGSGILAIAAAKLGYHPITALDFDAAAIGVAKANARRNMVRFHLACQDVARLPRHVGNRPDLVCANLAADVLLQYRERIVAQVAPGGVLVLAGILQAEFGPVRRAYEAAGLHLARSRAEREWQSGAFIHPHKS